MFCVHASQPAQSLLQILVAGAIYSPRPISSAATRVFSTTVRTNGSSRAIRARPASLAVPNYRPRDSLIRHRVIQLVDEETEKLLPYTSTLYDVLNRMDSKTHFLEQVTPDEPGNQNFIPICRLHNKKEYRDRQRARDMASKASKKQSLKSSIAGMKTIELNWAIDEHDLMHRIGRLQGFLAEGRRVEVVLARKKGGRRATIEECEEVLKKVRSSVDKVDGARELKVADRAKLGGFMAIMFLGKEMETKAPEEESQAEADENQNHQPATAASGT